MTQEPIQQLEDKHNESEEIRTTRLKGQNIQQTREKTTKYFVRVEKLYK